MIYLDHAAATPLSAKVKKAMEPYFADNFFNPSAPYFPAKKVRAEYDTAKDRIAHTIGAKGNDIVITAGATESINLAFTVATKKVLVLETEHQSVLETAKNFDCKLIKVDKTGLIVLNDFRKKLDGDVGLVSISLANNELGTIQPLAEISEIIRAERQNRLKNGNKTPLYFHSDASQALNLIDINVARLGVDLLTINSAKIYGPKGVGALYVAHGVKLKPITFGGGQENGLRSGTENVPSIIGFAVAAEEAKTHLNGNRKHYEKLQKIFREELKDAPIEPIFLGNKKHQLLNFCPVAFSGIDAERIIYKLEDKEIYLSTGAACAASKGEKSHVLKAIGLTDDEIAGSLRISFGALNSEEDIKTAAKEIKTAIEEELARLGGESA
ncbi:cysteine desulfurase [Candidatus Saccharibacteria bacterium]|nr:cysteine desulfurase [Candidatus Saccharibacteria bacterium]